MLYTIEMPSLAAVNGTLNVQGFFVAGRRSEDGKGTVIFYSDVCNDWYPIFTPIVN